MCSVPADWSLPAEACEWLYLIMQLPSDRRQDWLDLERFSQPPLVMEIVIL